MTIIAKISNIIQRLAPNEKLIAQVILDSPNSAMLLSSVELAKQAGVSQSSIVKFSQKLGFKGYPAFKLAVTEEIGRKKAILANKDKLHNNITLDDTLQSTAQKLAQEKINALLDTTNNIDFIAFEKAIALLNGAEKIQIVGIGGSALVAKELSYKLLKIGLCGLSEVDSHVQLAISQTLSANDVQLVISFSGNRKEITFAASAAKRNKATVIAITSQAPSALRDIADICIDTLAEETEQRSSSISSRTAQNTITDLLFIALLQKQEDEAKTLIQFASDAIQSLNL
jgi:RpiR family transcriptional regulator, murPQ operon repressor